jgi:alpha-tubulin suppressor-like RCC1 family protein
MHTASITNLQFVAFSDAELIKTVSSGEYTTCMIFSSGRLRCFGYNAQGQCGFVPFL